MKLKKSQLKILFEHRTQGTVLKNTGDGSPVLSTGTKNCFFTKGGWRKLTAFSFGNTLTETTFTDGEFGTIYRSFGYDQDNNNLVKETDARGYSTEYAVDETTSRNQEVTDRLGNKTAYEYDQSGRTTKVTSKNSENQE